MPQVSILMASYNYAEYIGEAIDSVLAQTFADWELIVMDDGSTDKSRDIINTYCAQDERIRLYTHADDGNHGLSKTLQLGLEHAQGEYIAFLESDDVWLPANLEHKRGALLSHPETGLAFSDISPFGSPMRPSLERGLHRLRTTVWQANKPTDYASVYPQDNAVPTFSCWITRHDLLKTCDWNSPVDKWLDWWILGQLACRKQFVFLPETLVQWRIHAASYAAAPDAENRKYFVRRLRRFLMGHTSPLSVLRLFRQSLFPCFYYSLQQA